MKGLVIRQPWIGMILRGEKVWEMRSQPCRHRGMIALIEKGSGTVVGLARLIDDLSPLTEAGLRSTIAKHRIPSSEICNAVANRWTRPWVLAEVSRLRRPVRYNHTSGGSWVNLSAKEEEEILSLHNLSATPIPAPHSSLPYVTGGSGTVAHAELEVRPIAYAANNLSIAHCSKRAKMNHQIGEALDLIGRMSALFALGCQVGFPIHFIIGIYSPTVSAFSAFKWLLPMVGFAMISSALGQGHLLETGYAKR